MEWSHKTVPIDHTPQRVVTGVVSTTDVDWSGDVVIPQGADASYLDKHKSINLYHDPNRPIGKHLTYKVKPDDRIIVQFQVGTHAEGNEAWTMIQEGVLNCLSIEYRPIDASPPTPNEKSKWGQNVRRVLRKWHWNGYAVVAQPDNGNAVILETKARVNDWLVKRVRSGKVALETAVRLGMEAEPRSRYLVAGGLVWTLPAVHSGGFDMSVTCP